MPPPSPSPRPRPCSHCHHHCLRSATPPICSTIRRNSESPPELALCWRSPQPRAGRRGAEAQAASAPAAPHRHRVAWGELFAAQRATLPRQRDAFPSRVHLRHGGGGGTGTGVDEVAQPPIVETAPTPLSLSASAAAAANAETAGSVAGAAATTKGSLCLCPGEAGCRMVLNDCRDQTGAFLDHPSP